ncbi:hypothetical protein PU630_01660 [Microbacterium horticulturae]|uniref:Excreted virulence factor EspC, type VII ESX diderm n=1 Tax=Microbacterium horticulturae TaxID=3028316 RepID=A0ABY8BYL6_9MICO|nr:hypothetical protein [Microbacterium sp. KACC 23027]WEG09295.1 hypothetical protein PU630_01660 [Microbacterium sp. KACC 23027]
MAGQIAIDQDLIIAHAARVRQVSSDVQVARNAASATNMSGGAFGVMCAFLIGPATLVASAASAAIASAQGLVDRSATEIRGVADDMAAFEDELSASIRQIESALG